MVTFTPTYIKLLIHPPNTLFLIEFDKGSHLPVLHTLSMALIVLTCNFAASGYNEGSITPSLHIFNHALRYL
jgi:hypothetical protein